MQSFGEQTQNTIDDLVEQASMMAGDYDFHALQVFAQQLRGLGDSRNDRESLSLLPKLRMPKGFYHARYTVHEVTGTGRHGEPLLGHPAYLGEVIDSKLRPLDLITLVRSALVFTNCIAATSMGPGRWIESFALPIRTPSMFELALVVEPREINDGSERARIQAALNFAKSRV